MASFNQRFRDPKTGRFVRNDGRRKLTLEVFVGNRQARILETKRYRIPSATTIIREQRLEFSPTVKRAKVTGRTLGETLSQEHVLSRLRGKQVAKVTLQFQGIKGQSVTITKTIKLAVTGRNKAGQNRAIILRTMLAEVNRHGFKISPKKFRTGAAARTPLARNVSLSIDAA